MFDELTALTDLSLHDNGLSTLPAGVFNELTSLTTLNLGDNPGAPFSPTAVALPDDGEVLDAGGDVTLDGSGSDGGPWGTNVTYSWAASGAAVTFDDAASATPVVTIPALADGTELTFTLTVTGRATNTSRGSAPATDTATVTAVVDPTAGICGRTEAVRDAIVARISGVASCADVTDAQLAAITGTLDLRSDGITTLAAGDFDGLTALTTLRLRGNSLSTLPAGVFDELTALTTLDLRNNSLSTLPAGVFDKLTALTTLRLEGNLGAPFSPEADALPDDGTVPVAGGDVTLDGSGSGGPWSTNVTYSWALTSPTSGVTVTFDDAASATPVVTIPALADGTELTFTLTVTGRATNTSNGSAPDTDTATVTSVFDPTAGICGRTEAVRDAIVALISGVVSCADVTDTQLAAITGTLSLDSKGISALAAGDFDELTALTALDLQNNSLSTLPAGVFDELTALTALDLQNNSLSTLPAGVFDNNTALTALYLNSNSLSTLPAGVFDGLTALTTLSLSNTSLSTLPAGVFDQLTALTDLFLHTNSLSTLPAGVFDQLTALTSLTLGTNSLSTLRAGVFDQLTAVTNLQLHDNSLSTLPAGVFDQLTALTTLRLQDNPGAPFSPTADALPDDGTVPAAGGDVTLDGSGSGGPWGTNVTYSWAAGGAAVTFDDAASATPVVTIPALAAGIELTFTLTVTGRATNASNGSAPDTDTATVTAVGVPELSFAPNVVTVNEDAVSATLTVELDPASTGTVTVDYATRDGVGAAKAGEDYTATSGTLTFAATETSKTFTVPILDDDVYENNESFSVDLTNPTGATLVASGATVRIDSEDAVPTASMADVTVDEGAGTMTLTLRLSHPSDAEIAYFTIYDEDDETGTATEGDDYDDFLLGPGRIARITVPAGDLSQTFDITIVDDGVDEPDETIKILWEKNINDEVTPSFFTFTGTFTDNDTAGVTVSKTALTVTEADTTGDSYTVVLDSQPTANVVVTVAGHAGTEVLPAPTTLTFTSTTWNTPQPVTVTAADDTDTANDTVSLTHSAASTDSNYDAIVIGGVTVTVEDHDTAQVTGVMVAPGNAQLTVGWAAVANATGYEVQWKSGGQSYNTSDRQATVASGSTTSHTLPGLANDTEYTVRVRATRTGANDGPYSDEEMATPKAAGVTVSKTSLTVTEEDTAGDSYTVVLDNQPTASVVVTVAGHAGTEVLPAPTTLTFTSTTWNTPQPVTVTAADDTDTANDEVSLTHSAASTDSDYDAIVIGGVTVTVEDNDTAQVTGVMVAPGNARLTVGWAAVANATGYEVQWKSGGQSYNTSDRQATVASGSTTSHTLPGLANDTEYTVRVRATRTGANDGPYSDEAMATPKAAGVTVSTTALTVTEEDTTGDSYTVVLDSQPTASVVVTVAGHAGTEVLPAPTTLTFTSTTWNTPQPVTVTAADDTDTANDEVTLTHSATSTDTDYSGITIGGVTVTVNDDDTANSAPTFTSAATFDAAENQTAVGTVAASDGDADDTVTGYAIQGGADRSTFSIVETTGVLTFASAPNFEAPTDADTDNAYVVVVRATSGTGARVKTADQTITVTVTDVAGEAPGVPAAPMVTAASVTSVTAAWTAPANAGPPITDYDYRYRVTSPQGAWTEVTTTAITGLSATITGLVEDTGYDVQVRATTDEGTSGWSGSGSGSTDANAAPAFTSAATFDAAENQTAVGTVVASDGDAGDTVTGYAIQGGADASTFSIVPATGVLTFASAPNFEAPADADTDNAYVAVVRATSGTGDRVKTADQTITVTVTDVDGEAPGVPAAPMVTAAGVTSVTASWTAPANAGPPITDYDYRYRVTSPQGSWTEVTTTAITGLSATITGLVEDTGYDVQVRATTDEGTSGWSGSGSGSTDANAAPAFTSAATFDAAENQTAVGTVVASDGDAGDTVTGYAIQGGADASTFSIVPATGVLTFASAPNFEAPADADTDNAYVAVVRATSGTGDRVKTADQTITVTVTDVAGEAPGVPAAPMVTAASVTSVTAAWTAPANAGPPITDYDYRYRVTSPQGSWTEVTTTAITGLSATITGLVEDTGYDVQVRATTDEGTSGWSGSGSGSTDANAAPTFTSAATFDAAENQTAVGTVVASDGDAGDTVTGYAIQGGADASTFSIVPATGVLTFASAPNFEAPADADTDNAYVAVVRATSGTGDRVKTADQTITVTVTDVDGEAPGVPAAPMVTAASVTSVTAAWTAPANAGPPITDYDYRYRVTSPQGAWTEVTTTAITGLSATITGLVEDTGYDVQVRATTDEGTSGWSGSGSGSTDANAAPAFTSAATFDAAENQTAVGTVVASDGDVDDTVTGYAIQGGADRSTFSIVETSGVLTFASAPNFEAPADADTDNAYVVVVRATSGTGDRVKTADQTITVTVTDVDGEAPGVPAAPMVTAASVTSVTAAWTAPANAGPPITDYDYRYRVTSPQGAWTEVTGTTITALGATITGLAEDTEYDVQVRATTDEGTSGWSGSGSGSTDANAAPAFTSAATFDAAENQTAVGTVAASDGDADDTVTGYAIQGGADRSTFSIVETTGVLTFASAPNFEAPADADTDNAYVVVVRATSGTGDRVKTADQTITVTVTDVAGEAPGVPAAPMVTAASVTSVTAAWTAPANAGPPITDYDYRYRVTAPQGAWTAVTTTAITGLSATITGLVEDTGYDVQVRATTDEGTSGWSGSGSGSTDANAAPAFTSAATFDAAENQTAVGTVVASDGDVDDTVTGYAIQGGADRSTFSIVETSGVLTFASAPNFEAPADADTDNAYVVVVRATSGTGARAKTADQTITVTVTDVAGEAPDVPAAPMVTAASVTSVTAAWTTPANAGPPITDYDYRYRVTAPQGSWTEVTGTTITALSATMITGLAEDTWYDVQVRATNDEGTSGWSLSGSGSTYANAAPAFTSAATFDAAENQTVVGTVQASDSDTDDTVTGYAIQGGADRSTFSIVETTGVLTFASAPNFEAPADADTDNAYVVVVRATSGTGDRVKTADQTITVTVTDVDGEAPGVPAAPMVTAASVTSVTAAWTAPANAGPPITDYDYRYRVTSPQGAWTEVTGTTITALGATITGLAEDTEYDVQVRATTDEGTSGWSASGSGSTDANAAPAFTSAATFDAAENQTAVGTVVASDSDTDDTVTGYAIQGGADRSTFSIVETSGVLTFASAPNFEAPADADTDNAYVVVVRATSGTGARVKTADQTITVTVTDVAGEAPGVPAAPMVTAASATSVTAAWTAPANAGPPITDYDYRYRVTAPQGSWTEVTGTAITALSATITGLAENTGYDVQVRATTDEGTSGWSASGSGSTDANAAPAFTSAATFDAAENQTAVGTVVASDSDTDDTVTGYAIQGGADRSTFSIVETTGVLTFASAPNFEAPADADTDNAYMVVVRATSGTGARVKTADQTITVTVTDVAGEAPGVPAAPMVTAASATSVTAAWTAPANAGPPITDYDYRYRVTAPQGPWTEVTTTAITGLSVTITGIAENTEYDVQVRATTDEGTSGWSASGSGSTDANNTPATGQPTISGVAQVGSLLTAGKGTIADVNGTTKADNGDSGYAYTYQWIRVDGGTETNISDATSSTYTPVDDDEGKKIKVGVSFQDDANHSESKTSAATATVTGNDNDTGPALSIADASAAETAGHLLFEVTLSRSLQNTVKVDFETISGGTATEGVDYWAHDYTHVIPAGETTTQMGFALIEDTVTDAGETVMVRLSNARLINKRGKKKADLDITRAEATGTITAPPTTTTPVPGLTIRIRDATGDEDNGYLDFRVRLSRKHTDLVCYDFETISGGTAAEGTDYLKFPKATYWMQIGKRVDTPFVRIIDDSVNDNGETVKVKISNAHVCGDPSQTVSITRAEATGTIRNTDPLPRALMARFGRTSAVHVVEHVEERLAAPREVGVEAQVAGRQLRPGMERELALDVLRQLGSSAGMHAPGAGSPGARSGPPMGEAAGSLGLAAGMGGPAGGGMGVAAGPMHGMAGPDGGLFDRGLRSMGLGGEHLLTRSYFALTRETRQGGILSFWSRGARSSFTGREAALSLGGEMRTTMVGADYAKGPLVTGLSLSNSRGLGEYAGVSGGQVASAVTGLYPWLGYTLSDRVSVWGVTGYGKGALTLTPGEGAPLTSGLSMAMAAAGTRGALVAGGASGFELAFKADALWVGTSIDGVEGPGGHVAATAAAVTRFRTGLEGARDYTLGRLSLRPSVEVGLRHDGGDAETGAGLDVGGGLVVSDASTGLTVDVRVRMLVLHQADGFSERGMALSLSYNPTPSTPLGLTARVAPSWGGQATSGAEALWGRETMAGMANGGLAAGNRLDGEVGYGLPVGSRFVGTPTFGVGTSESGRDYRLGYSLGALGGAGMKFELGVDAQRRERSLQGGTDHGALARASMCW